MAIFLIPSPFLFTSGFGILNKRENSRKTNIKANISYLAMVFLVIGGYMLLNPSGILYYFGMLTMTISFLPTILILNNQKVKEQFNQDIKHFITKKQLIPIGVVLFMFLGIPTLVSDLIVWKHPAGPTCGKPQSLPHVNKNKIIQNDEDIIVEFYGWDIVGYINPPKSGRLHLKLTDRKYGDVLPRCGSEGHFNLQVEPHTPSNERYYFRFNVAPMGDGSVDPVYLLTLYPDDGTEPIQIYKSSGSTKRHHFSYEEFSHPKLAFLDLVDEKFNIYGDLFEVRAKAYAQKGEYALAIKDIDEAINHNKFMDIVKVTDLLQLKAVYLSFENKHYESARMYEEILDKYNYRLKGLSRYVLLYWLTLVKAGDKEKADSILNEYLQKAKNNGETCWVDFAEFLLGKFDEQVFIDQKKKKGDQCIMWGDGSLALAYFYVGQMKLVTGDTNAAVEFFKMFLNKDTTRVSSDIEKKMAQHYIDIHQQSN